MPLIQRNQFSLNNLVYTTGNYINPPWIISISPEKVGNFISQWNANMLQGYPIYTGVPTNGTTLSWNGPSGYWISSGVPVPLGGTSGQIIAKASDSNYDVHWIDDAGPPRFSGIETTSISGVFLSGVPFYTVITSSGVSLSTDVGFYYNSGTNTLFVPTGQIENLSFLNAVQIGNSTTSRIPSAQDYSILIGKGAGLNSTAPTGNSNQIFIGQNAGYEYSSAETFTYYYDTFNKDIAIGYSAGSGAKPSNSIAGYIGNIAIGESASANSSGTRGTIHIGPRAGSGTIYNQYALCIGYNAGAISYGNSNNFIGTNAGYGVSGNYNLGIGYYPLRYVSGARNIEITASGLGNTLAGNNSNKLNIGETIIGDTSNKKLAIGDVGTVNLSPNATVEILPKNTTDKSLILKGTVSYNTNFLEVQDSTSTVKSYIDKDYNISTTGNIIGNTGVFNSIDLTPRPDTDYPTWHEGLIFYDYENKALVAYNDEPDVTQQLGQETYVRARNNNAYTILNNKAVYINGSQGTHPTINLAIANNYDTSKLIGIATHDIEPNSFGYITVFGVVHDFDTTGFTDGQEVFLSPSVSGGLTTTPVEAPNFDSFIGFIIRGGVTNGSVFVNVSSSKFAGIDTTSLSGISLSGIPFYSIVTDNGASLHTDAGFYYNSGTNSLFVPTGNIQKLLFTNDNVRIGDFAGDSSTYTTDNILIGNSAGGSATLADSNTFIGIAAGYGSSGNSTSSALGGYNALAYSINMNNTTAIGDYAGSYASGANDSLFIGNSAGTESKNLDLTFAAFGGQHASGSNNLYFGSIGGYYASGSNNIEISTSASNILNGTYSNKLNIGNILVSDMLSKRVAIGNVSSSNLSPNATIEILPSGTTTKGILVKGNPSQSANLLEVQNSSSAHLFSTSTTGVLSNLPIYAYGSNTDGWALEVKNTANFSYGLKIQNTNDLYAPYNHFSIQKANGTQMFGILDSSITTYNQNISINGGSAPIYSGGTNITIGSYCGSRFANSNSNANNFIFGTWAGGSSDGGVSSTATITNNFIFGYYSFGYYTATGALDNNYSFGNGSLQNIRYGGSNISFGQGSLGSFQGGNYNINMGQGGFGTIASGSYNIGIGQGTVFPSSCNYSIAIGQGATVVQNNQLVLGSTATKIGKSDGTGEQSISSTTPSGISKFLQATINGSTYQIPLLPSGATDLQRFSALSVSGGIEIPSGIPAVTTSKLYASGTTLYFNGSGVGGGGAALSGGTASGVTFWTSSTTVAADSSFIYSSGNKYLQFTGTGVSANPMKMRILDDSTLSFESTAGQLFSIADGLSSGTIFSVNDISGMPSLEIDASGLIKIGEYDGFIGFGTSQTYGQYVGKIETTYPSGYKGIISRPASGDSRNAFEVQTYSSGTVISLNPSGTVNVNMQSATAKGLIIKNAASQSANVLEIQNSAGTPIMAVTPSGAVSGAILPTIITSTGGLTLGDAHNGYIIEQTGIVASGTFTLGSITLPSWNCMVVNIGSGVIIASGTNTMNSPGGLNKSRTQYSSVSIYRRGDGSFILGGDLA